mmetsp:Transcript_11115/g.16899  ORF Transcript_11115/g.16899 Transcript_11115/m.16899 type:complete len:131 (+) Transcript_11115:4364-4756(+)
MRPNKGGVYNVVVPDIKLLHGANSPPELSKEFSSQEPIPEDLYGPMSQGTISVQKYQDFLKSRLQNIQSSVQDQGSKANAKLLDGVLEHLEDFIPDNQGGDNLAMKFNQFFQVAKPDSIYSSQGSTLKKI